MRIKGVISYDGSAFEGFQRQTRTGRTVTGELERVLGSLGIQSSVIGSGRTDAGVHASGQVIHFDLPPYWAEQPLEKLRRHTNGKMEAIRIKHLCAVPDGFHARYDARERIYRYVFKANTPSVFERKYVSSLQVGNWERLKESLGLFIGTHDFSLFMKSGSDTRYFVRTIRKAYTLDRGPYRMIYFHADGFLRAQVRMMIHAAVAVAKGRLSVEALQEQIEGKRRHVTGLAPPEGLYLARVIY
ncbi:tRNA pseudouridine(38-40) synthase TruA [Nitratifractor sp.]